MPSKIMKWLTKGSWNNYIKEQLWEMDPWCMVTRIMIKQHFRIRNHNIQTTLILLVVLHSSLTTFPLLTRLNPK